MSKRTILIAEDDSDVRALTERVLARFGDYRIQSYDDGNDLDKRLKGGLDGVALVITDNDVAERDLGLNIIRRYASTLQIPFILMSADNSLVLEQKAIEAGAYAFVAKPYRINSLRRIVQNALNEKQSA